MAPGPSVFPDDNDIVLSAIRNGTASTRSDLVRVTGLSRSTVSQRVDALMAAGLVAPAAERTTTGGRPAAILRFNGSSRYIYAADVGATVSHLGLVDLAGTLLVHERVEWDIAQGPRATVAMLEDKLHSLVSALPAGGPSAVLSGVGVGLPGPVEAETGRPVSPPIMPGWNGAPVRTLLGETFGVVAEVDNDVNIAALGCWIQRNRTDSDLVFVKAASGIGAGIVTNAALVRGAQGSAGDIGHIPVAPDSRVICACGNYGCLEAVAGGRALAIRLTEQGLPTRDARDVAAHVVAGQPQAVAAVREAGRALGQVLASVVNVLNPATVIVGGSLAGAADSLLAGVREVIYQRCPPLATKMLQIEVARPDSNAGVLGAAALVQIQHHARRAAG